MRYVISIDLNDTVTLDNKVDPDKTIETVINQLVAQNVYLDCQNLENFIKSTISDKKLQREAYKNLDSFVENLNVSKELEIRELIVNLRDQYFQAWSKCESGFFKSFINFVKYIEKNFPSSTIIIQSFGLELPNVMEYLKNISTFDVSSEIIDFNNLDFSKISNTFKNLHDSLIENSILFWRNSYDLWKNNQIGKPQFVSTEFQYLFFDDNADICSTIVNSEDFSIVKDFNKYLIKVDTAQALINENYFIEKFEELV